MSKRGVGLRGNRLHLQGSHVRMVHRDTRMNGGRYEKGPGILCCTPWRDIFAISGCHNSDCHCVIALVWHDEGKHCVTLSVWSDASAGVNALYVSWQTQQPPHCLRGLKTCCHTFTFTVPTWMSVKETALSVLEIRGAYCSCLIFSLALRCFSGFCSDDHTLCGSYLRVDFSQWNKPKPKGCLL